MNKQGVIRLIRFINTFIGAMALISFLLGLILIGDIPGRSNLDNVITYLFYLPLIFYLLFPVRFIKTLKISRIFFVFGLVITPIYILISTGLAKVVFGYIALGLFLLLNLWVYYQIYRSKIIKSEKRKLTTKENVISLLNRVAFTYLGFSLGAIIGKLIFDYPSYCMSEAEFNTSKCVVPAVATIILALIVGPIIMNILLNLLLKARRKYFNEGLIKILVNKYRQRHLN